MFHHPSAIVSFAKWRLIVILISVLSFRTVNKWAVCPCRYCFELFWMCDAYSNRAGTQWFFARTRVSTDDYRMCFVTWASSVLAFGSPTSIPINLSAHRSGWALCRHCLVLSTAATAAAHALSPVSHFTLLILCLLMDCFRAALNRFNCNTSRLWSSILGHAVSAGLFIHTRNKASLYPNKSWYNGRSSYRKRSGLTSRFYRIWGQHILMF